MPILIILSLLLYFAFLLWLSRRAERHATNDGNAFFRGKIGGNAWPMVAIGMISASISGVTFVSVPAWCASTGMTYLQMNLGFIAGYFIVAFGLLPIYYKLRLTSIYAYLGERFGAGTHRAGAIFFIFGKLLSAAACLYAVCAVLHFLLKNRLAGTPFLDDFSFAMLAIFVIALIWFYTRRGGIAVLVQTDVLQTICMVFAAGTLFFAAKNALNLDLAGTWREIAGSPMSRIFEWNWASPQNFWKQFLAGTFVVVAMTGLDQNMMQKNLTCKTLRAAQKNMCVYGAMFLPINALLLALGVLLYSVCAAKNIVPANADALLPTLVSSDFLGNWAMIPFLIGLIAAAFSSADSALTALTTSVVVDLNFRGNTKNRAHFLLSLALLACVLIFYFVKTSSAIHLVYTLVSYTYGPLLGLFGLGILTRVPVRDRLTFPLCILSVAGTAFIDFAGTHFFAYKFGYELLLINALLCAGLLWLSGTGIRHIPAKSENSR